MSTRTSTVRPYAESDFDDLVALLSRSDRIPGQPEVTESMVREALAGRSPIDGGWWAELRDLRHIVVPAGGGGLAGAAAVGVSSADGVGYLLWVAAEDRAATEELVAAAVEALGSTKLQRAFFFATALDEGMEALPVHLRPDVHQALLDAGFTDQDFWVYMRRRLDNPDDPVVAAPEALVGFDVVQDEDPARWKVTATGGDGEGVVEIGILPSGTGIVEWLHVDDSKRGRGLGRAVLAAGLHKLASLGVSQVILYVDHDAPGTERDRTSALKLYEAMGFETVDHLHSYERTTP